MGLEVANYINALNKLWPLGTDPKEQGDDHIRQVKSVLQNQFVNFGLANLGLIMRSGPDRICINDQRDGSGTDLWTLARGQNPPGFMIVTVRTSGTGSYTRPAGLRYLLVELLGAGAGGGGAVATAAGQMSVGSGGGAGGYARKLYDFAAVGAAAISWGVGAAGGNGVNGGLTNWGPSFVANGGSAGSSSVAGSGIIVIQGGSGGSVSSGDVQGQGAHGGDGWAHLTNLNCQLRGRGGDTFLGAGGKGLATNVSSTGAAASGYGAGGGGGGCAASSSAVGGGAGGQGMIITTEFF